MLLFTDGFEGLRPLDIGRKWGMDGFSSWDCDEDKIMTVTGMDNSVSPPQRFARKEGGRALYRNYSSALPLKTYIRKSRTVFLGFGFRHRGDLHNVQNPVIRFYTRTFPGVPGKMNDTRRDTHALVATCTLTIGDTFINFIWEFPSEYCANAYGQLNANGQICNGEWQYLQLGISLHGNNPDGAQAWVENRIGSLVTDRIDNIFTAAPESENSYYIDSIEVDLGGYSYIDDVYIANDEGNVNNDFLGPIYIRTILPETQGSVNDGVPVNSALADRAQLVNSLHIGTFEQLPVPLPDPDDDQHFLEWEDPRAIYLNLPEIGDKQLFDFSNPNFAGSEPKFFGAVAYMMTRPGYYDHGQTSLRAVMKSGFEEVEMTMPLRRPLMYLFNNEWETRRGVFENPDVNKITGFLSPIWNRTAIANAEFGLEVIRAVDDPESYLPEHLRVKYIFDDSLEEGLGLLDFSHRFWEETMELTFGLSPSIELDLTFAAYDAFGLSDDEGTIGVKGVKKYVNSVLYLNDVIPWTYLFIGEELNLAGQPQITWAQVVEEILNTIDIGYQEWVEQFQDGLDLEDVTSMSQSLIARDDLEMGDSVLTNQELIEDGFQMDSSYIFSGHEFVAETLYPNSDAFVGVLELVPDTFGLEEEHYNGWFVAVIAHQFSITDLIETQQWRHEFLLGLCIDSWQIEPIEQESNYGDRTGQFTSEYQDSLP
jgi:hypothetical protein